MLKVGQTQIRGAHISSGLLATRLGGVRDIAGASSGIDKLLHLVVEVFPVVEGDRLLPGRPTLVGGHEIDEFAEDGELQLELDAVYDALEGCLDDVVVGELDTEKRNVHEDDKDVDGE